MLINRNVRYGSGKTSMRMEPLFWQLLDEICEREGIRIVDLIQVIDAKRKESPVPMTRTEAARLVILNYVLEATTEEGHEAAGHGGSRKRWRAPILLPRDT
jgi:predicted DNA-binding ribbon-helix-helix protein